MSNSTSESAPDLVEFIQTIGLSSTPLTPENITRHLSAIDDEIRRVKKHIKSKIQSNWNVFERQWTTGQKLYLDSIQYEEQFNKIHEALDGSENSCIPRLLTAVQSHQSITADYHQATRIFLATQALSIAYDSISELSVLIDSGQFENAARKITKSKASVYELAPHRNHSLLVERVVKRVQELEEILKQRLIDIIRQGVTFSDDHVSSDLAIEIMSSITLDTKTKSKVSIPWSSALGALQAMGEIECGTQEIKRIASRLIEKVTLPLTKATAAYSTSLCLVQEPASKEASSVLHLKHHKQENIAELFDSLRLLLSTLRDMLLTSHSEQSALAQYFVPSLEAQLITLYLDPSLPLSVRNQTELLRLPELILQTREFASWLGDNHWLDQNSIQNSSLVDWCNCLKDRFVNRAAARILEMARKEMIGTQWESIIVPWTILQKTRELPPSTDPPLTQRNQLSVPSSLQRSVSLSNHPHSPQNPSSFSIVRQFTEPLKQAAGVREAVSFKSLFKFGSGVPSSNNYQRDSSSSERDDSPIDSNVHAKSFQSMFDFTQDDRRQLSVDTSQPLHSSSHTEKTSSPEMVERPSTLQSRESSKSRSDYLGASPSQVEPENKKPEEDVDWDMGVDTSTENVLESKTNSHDVHISNQQVPEEEVEEDAWGLDEVRDETLLNHELSCDTGLPVGAERHGSGAKSWVTNAPSSQEPNKSILPDEATEPDPSAWGFDEEEVITADESEVLRLRGGMPSSSASDVDDEGWGWNDDMTNEQPQSQEDQNSASQKSKVKQKDDLGHPRTAEVSIQDPFSHTTELTISKLAQRVIDIVNEVIEDARIMSDPNYEISCLSECSPGLIRVGLDVLDLYQIVMPIYHSQLLDSVPSLSIQFANDCDWLATEIQLIPGLKDEEETGKVSMRLKHLGRRIRKNQMNSQHAILMECLDQAEGFLDVSNEERFNSCERVCKQLIHTLQRLSQVWKPVMLPPEYLLSMGQLVEGVLSRILNEIKAQTDISAEDSKQLNVLCKSLHCLYTLFGDQDDQAEIARHVPSWFKFCFLSELLEASMADIMWMHQEGLLSEFSPDEIIGLIKALFADSDLRAKNIDIISSSSVSRISTQ